MPVPAAAIPIAAGVGASLLGGRSKPAKYEQQIPADLQGLRGQMIPLLQSLLGGGGQGLESFFGPMGSPATPLQRQSTNAASQFLNQPAPEQRAMDVSLPALQAILSGTPGQGIMDQLRPQFDRNLSAANQQ